MYEKLYRKDISLCADTSSSEYYKIFIIYNVQFKYNRPNLQSTSSYNAQDLTVQQCELVFRRTYVLHSQYEIGK